MLEFVMLLAPLKRSYGNQAKRYGERILAEVVMHRRCENYSYKFILQLTFEASLTFITQHNEMVVHSVHPCCV